MKTNLFSFSILIALSIIWGTSFVLMKWGMSWNEKPTFSAEEVAGLRIFFASVFLIPLLYKHFKAFNFKKYGLPVFGMGMFGNFIPAFLFTAAETKINSSLAGMLNALTPLFTILISVFIFRVKSSRVQLYGVTLGFVGAVMLMYFNGEQTNSTTTMGYSGLVVLATLCYAISVNIIRRYLSDLSSITAAVFAFAFIGPIAFIYLITRTEVMQTINNNPDAMNSLLAVSVLGIVGSALSVIVFNTLIKSAGAVFASSVTYLIPVVAIFWGFTEGEPIAWQQLAAMLVILGAIYLINPRKPTTT